MPCDKQSNYISDEYFEVINDLEYMLESDEHDEYFFMGDWNSDFNRNNTQSKELMNFLDRNRPMAVPHSDTFTYQSHDLKNRSLIDHIFILESGQYSHNCGPIQHLQHGCNLSSHTPLICNIIVPLSNDNPNRRESHTWYRVTTLTLSQWSSSGNPVAIQCTWNLDPSVHWNATGEMPVCFQWSSSGFPVVFQCVPIMQINTGSPLGHHWVQASASVVPVASQCTCGSSGLSVCSNYAN